MPPDSPELRESTVVQVTLVAFRTNDWAPPDRMTGQWEVEARQDDRGGEKQKEKFLRKSKRTQDLNPGSGALGTSLCRHGYDATVRGGFPLGVTLRRAVVADEPVPVASSGNLLSTQQQPGRVATLKLCLFSAQRHASTVDKKKKRASPPLDGDSERGSSSSSPSEDGDDDPLAWRFSRRSRSAFSCISALEAEAPGYFLRIRVVHQGVVQVTLAQHEQLVKRNIFCEPAHLTSAVLRFPPASARRLISPNTEPSPRVASTSPLVGASTSTCPVFTIEGDSLCGCSTPPLRRDCLKRPASEVGSTSSSSPLNVSTCRSSASRSRSRGSLRIAMSTRWSSTASGGSAAGAPEPANGAHTPHTNTAELSHCKTSCDFPRSKIATHIFIAQMEQICEYHSY
ncbi:Chromobox protein-like protein 2 [Frankliniella fusca]|uniref:Chromobox protein-like protein 2 n=1 Tax=Frankliniella fusca TaxID=407009 RepID=A0AAE1HQA0_9NEOP|nr:Chromobox protein-like protein 2 [Frankliniella fusca]